MSEVRRKWWDIGLGLSIPYDKMREFEVQSDPFEAVIEFWINGNVSETPVTWRSLAAALDASSEKNLAEMIKLKYCQTESIVSCKYINLAQGYFLPFP